MKDVIIPMFGFWIGYGIWYYRENLLNYINVLFFPFILYGVLQEFIFYLFSGLDGLRRFLPWDYRPIIERIAAGPSNLLQGSLLRFNGTMNSFVEYQVVAVVLGCFLWLNKDLISRKKILYLNTLTLIVFLVFALERSPIMMGLILLLVWQLPVIWARIRTINLPKFGLTTAVVIVGLILGFSFLRNNQLTKAAFGRLEAALSLSLGSDQAVQMRISGEWNTAFRLFSENPLGLGAQSIAPDVKILASTYVAPHNNFMGYGIAFGWVGLFIFLVFLFLLLLESRYLRFSSKFFLGGLILSYAAMAFFNMPFIGKPGLLFFMLVRYLDLSRIPSKSI